MELLILVAVSSLCFQNIAVSTSFSNSCVTDAPQPVDLRSSEAAVNWRLPREIRRPCSQVLWGAHLHGGPTRHQSPSFWPALLHPCSFGENLALWPAQPWFSLRVRNMFQPQVLTNLLLHCIYKYENMTRNPQTLKESHLTKGSLGFLSRNWVNVQYHVEKQRNGYNYYFHSLRRGSWKKDKVLENELHLGGKCQ